MIELDKNRKYLRRLAGVNVSVILCWVLKERLLKERKTLEYTCKNRVKLRTDLHEHCFSRFFLAVVSLE